MELGHALLRATQERDHLLPGETSLLTLEVAVDGKRAPFDVKGSELQQPGASPSARPESLASVPFRDDGVAPDRAAKDGIASARVSVPEGVEHVDSELRVRADVSTASESGEVVFPLIALAAPPAVFTGTVREAVEDGSLAFYVGIRVDKPGRYDFIGRVYDSQHRVMAILFTNGNFDKSARETRLSFCGKLLRDENVPGPWELRDVEGFVFTEIAGRNDRVPMPTYAGPHRTKAYPLDTFSDAPAIAQPPHP
jgi:hypothetical protein